MCTLKRTVIAIASAAALGMSVSPVKAACTSCSCAIETTGLNFGAYNPLRPANGSVGVIRVTCENDSGYTLKISAGSSGDVLSRTMRSGSNVLAYNLYKDSGRSNIWGDGSGGQAGLSGSGTGNYNIYGSIAANQRPSVGAYMDSLIVLIDY